MSMVLIGLLVYLPWLTNLMYVMVPTLAPVVIIDYSNICSYHRIYLFFGTALDPAGSTECGSLDVLPPA